LVFLRLATYYDSLGGKQGPARRFVSANKLPSNVCALWGYPPMHMHPTLIIRQSMLPMLICSQRSSREGLFSNDTSVKHSPLLTCHYMRRALCGVIIRLPALHLDSQPKSERNKWGPPWDAGCKTGNRPGENCCSGWGKRCDKFSTKQPASYFRLVTVVQNVFGHKAHSMQSPGSLVSPARNRLA
jgi:hypothetical protein